MSVVVAAIQPYTADNLANEINNGPYKTTFAPEVTSKAYSNIAALLNDPTASASGPVYHADISGAQLLALVDPTELSSLSANDKDTFKFYSDSDEVVISNAALQTWLGSTFTQLSCPLSHAAIAADATRTGSRAEVLWGAGTVVTDVAINWALNRTNTIPFGS